MQWILALVPRCLCAIKLLNLGLGIPSYIRWNHVHGCPTHLQRTLPYTYSLYGGNAQAGYIISTRTSW